MLSVSSWSNQRLHIVVGMQLLNIFRMLHFDAFDFARFVELLTTTELFDNAGFVEFAFEFFNRALDVLTFFNWYYDHCIHLLSIVPRAGVEPARIAPLVFETSASTDSAIWAPVFQQDSFNAFAKKACKSTPNI